MILSKKNTEIQYFQRKRLDKINLTYLNQESIKSIFNEESNMNNSASKLIVVMW